MPGLLEVCVESGASAVAAERGGASRLELCSALALGGLTPSAGLLKEVRKSVKIPIFIMIRCRAGDFTYNRSEIDTMKNDIEILKSFGADGFVFGALDKNAAVDIATCKILLDSASPFPCTFHRAFDYVAEPLTALEQIISLGFKRILTSGQKPNARMGLPLIKQLNKAAGNRIVIMAGAGVNEQNAKEIVDSSGVKEIHGSASKNVPCETNYMHSISLGSVDDGQHFKETDEEIVKLIVTSVNK